MLVICSIALAVKLGSINIITKTDVEGVLLKENQTKYLVDFSKGVQKFDIAGKPEDYTKVLVNSTECVKE